MGTTPVSTSRLRCYQAKSKLYKIGLDLRKPVLGRGGGVANNKGADQPTHPRSLVSAFFIGILECIICKLAAGEISIF